MTSKPPTPIPVSGPPPRSRKRWFWLLVIPPLTLFVLSVASCSAPTLGLQDGRLLPLPDSPNCVSSLARDPAKKVAPLPLRTPAKAAQEGLKEILTGMPRTALLEEQPNYLRFVATSLILRFRDDIEFHLVPAENRIDVRSASRVGHSDFGVNRERVEAIRSLYDAWLAGQAKPK